VTGLFREPLLHFLVGGAVLFAVYAQVSGPGDVPRDRIVVNEARVASLVQSFDRTWMRPPSAEELAGLIDDYVTEEVLYREALALGLDRDDLIVRRRMRQKLEFLHEGLAEAEPDDASLRAFLVENPDRFRVPSRTTFEQVFVARGQGDAEVRVAEVAAQLRAGGDPLSTGDPTLLPGRLDEALPTRIAGSFGEPFARALAGVPLDAWTRVESSFGLHLVRVSAREPERAPPFEEIRRAVTLEWAAEQRAEARRRLHKELRGRYEVEVRAPAEPGLASRP
jgi:hypothetical protein